MGIYLTLAYLLTHTHYDCSDDSDGGSTDDDDDDDSSDDSDADNGNGSDDSLEGVAPTLKRRKHAREEVLKASLNSGRYPTFQDVEGPMNDLDPSVFEYLEIVWPSSYIIPIMELLYTLNLYTTHLYCKPSI